VGQHSPLRGAWGHRQLGADSGRSDGRGLMSQIDPFRTFDPA